MRSSSNNRGSDIYKDEWGTLIHLIVSRGLYDQNGVQYADNSFRVMKIPGLNADVFGRPIRWAKSKKPSGFSDHFPVMAEFRTVDDGDKTRWMPLNQPSTSDDAPETPLRVQKSVVDLSASALKMSDLPAGAALRDGSFTGRVFSIEAPASMDDRGFVHVTVAGEDYDVFTHDKDLRPRIRNRAKADGHLRFYGELGTYRGRWQFLLQCKEWLPGTPPEPQKKPPRRK